MTSLDISDELEPGQSVRDRKMSETSSNRANNYTSEASRMLEQALEQMDGIIQGAKYELPQYFETFSLQVDRSML